MGWGGGGGEDVPAQVDAFLAVDQANLVSSSSVLVIDNYRGFVVKL